MTLPAATDWIDWYIGKDGYVLRTSYLTSTLLLLLTVFCVGLAFIAALPPFEGYDETAHWSSLQEIADTGVIPVYGRDHLSADLLRYPGPSASPVNQAYQSWFAHMHGASAPGIQGPGHFNQGQELNWQAQHPPLYYLLLAPVYLLGAHLDWIHHFLLLRSVSWSLAFAGFAWGALRTQSLLRACAIADARLLIPPAWPLLFPEFFAEFARLTNDALVILLLAGVWSITLRMIAKRPTLRRMIALGVLLAAGLLTKAFFLPIVLSVLGLLSLKAYQRQAFAELCWMVALLALCVTPSATWYYNNLQTTGTITGGNDFIHLHEAGGLWAGLLKNFAPGRYAIGVMRILAQFAWAGTWSFVHPNRWLVAPIVASLVLGSALYLRASRHKDIVWLSPMFFAGPFLGGLLYHLLSMVAATGIGAGTPGWYLHILAAPLSMALAIGWRWPWIQGALGGYGVLFGALMVPWQLAFFSGCLNRSGTGGGTLAATTCFIDTSHLKDISLPLLSLLALTLGMLSFVAASAPLIRGRGLRAKVIVIDSD